MNTILGSMTLSGVKPKWFEPEVKRLRVMPGLLSSHVAIAMLKQPQPRVEAELGSDLLKVALASQRAKHQACSQTVWKVFS